MKRKLWIAGIVVLAMSAGCARHAAKAPALHATAFGSAIVESSGDEQLGSPGTALPQPLVVQVNDKDGNAVTGALVQFAGPAGLSFDPQKVLTDSSGQATTNVTLGGSPGRYEVTAASADAAGKTFDLKVTELAAGYEQQRGYELRKAYCARCHDQESTAEQVSNYDNLAVKPHAFRDGDTYNKLSDADLTAIINHGGPALNRSALMPSYGATLTKADTQALIAYIRLVSEPPYRAAGVVYANK
jgi:mono/diheme cytochrome c family protein